MGRVPDRFPDTFFPPGGKFVELVGHVQLDWSSVGLLQGIQQVLGSPLL